MTLIVRKGEFAVTEEKRAANFIEEFIDEDLKAGRFDRVHTRFPPEPNGYLHIGHAKALCIDFGIAKKYGGECNLRFDDTNPTKEDTEYVDGIMEDIRWLGYEWKNLYFASDFFDKLYEIACEMIRKGVAYVDDQSSEEMRKNRGTLRTPGVNSPYRDRSPEENLDLFQRMKAGEFPDGSRVLRAKIDMASPNVLMRDPTMYRILRHHTTARAISGASTRCTISSIPFRTRSRASRTRCARWNTKSTARCTTGWCSRPGLNIRRGRVTSPG